MFTIQRLRSHERQTQPQPWETVATAARPADAFRDAAERLAVAMPAGDAIRIVGPEDDVYGVHEFPHAYSID